MNTFWCALNAVIFYLFFLSKALNRNNLYGILLVMLCPLLVFYSQHPLLSGSCTRVMHVTWRRSATQRGCTLYERVRPWSSHAWWLDTPGHRWVSFTLQSRFSFLSGEVKLEFFISGPVFERDFSLNRVSAIFCYFHTDSVNSQFLSYVKLT